MLASLTDAPLASKLGPRHALFYHEEQNYLEKFRPYALPAPDWLAWVRGQFQSRVAGPPA